MFENLNGVLDKIAELGAPGFECVVLQNGEEKFRRRHVYKGGERMNIYSCSKPFTGIVAAQLYDRGLYELDTPVSKFLPEYADIKVTREDGTIAPAKNVMTIRNLLTMTSGMNYSMVSDFSMKMKKEKGEKFSTRDLAFCKAQDPLLFEPGTGWNYCLGLDVFGAALEVMTGQRFSDYVKENIFEPLGMKDSCYAGTHSGKSSDTPQFRYHADTAQYEEIDKGVQIPPCSNHYDVDLGGSGIISTVDDILKFLEGWRTGKLLSENAAKFMMTDHLNEMERASKQEKNNSTKYGYGIAMRVPYYDNGITDFGWGGAAGAIMGIDLKRNMSFYFSSHVLTSPFVNYRYPALYAAQKDLDEMNA